MASASPPSRADVVVVGGGCVGASAAFHLARRGENVVLLEKGHVASGATGHSGAIIRQHYESRIGIRLARRSLAFFQRFEEETGAACDFRTTGFLSGTRARDEPAFDRLFELLKSEGVRVERLTADETRTVEPHLDASDYVAVVHDPEAGYADPIATASGFATAAERGGATILEDVAMHSVVVRKGRVAGVRIRGGTIPAERVLLAAGNWTPSLAAEMGVRLPVRFVRGQVVVLRRPVGFERPPKIHFDFYHNTYSRPEGEKDVLAGYLDTDPRRAVRDHVLKDDSVPGATVRDIRARLAKRFPAMARSQPRGGWAGAYDVTPDSYPILGAVGPPGLFVAVGFSGHGFKLSPEVGRLLAESIGSGHRPEDLKALRASRYAEGAPVKEDAPFPAKRGPRLP
jgi:sarcosine oxidase subunit beta